MISKVIKHFTKRDKNLGNYFEFGRLTTYNSNVRFKLFKIYD